MRIAIIIMLTIMEFNRFALSASLDFCSAINLLLLFNYFATVPKVSSGDAQSVPKAGLRMDSKGPSIIVVIAY